MQQLAQAVIVFAAYLAGGLSPGYWLVRLRTGGDIRASGSGSAGATNAGRVLGAGGFAAVLALDLAKGAVCVAAARHLFNAPETTVGLAAAAVVLGHIWPLFLNFRGGKGVAPLIGAWLVLCPAALVPVLLLGLAAYAVVRSFSMAGLAGLCALPVSTWWFVRERAGADLPALQAGALALAVLVA
ncbi:MAG: glycerol-3-phosphate acyltransferase, partial [Opitutaceae bacterium]|nr:glycerol-3-phosphate acyltransferase [Opitutaceae bacterium]